MQQLEIFVSLQVRRANWANCQQWDCSIPSVKISRQHKDVANWCNVQYYRAKISFPFGDSNANQYVCVRQVRPNAQTRCAKISAPVS